MTDNTSISNNIPLLQQENHSLCRTMGQCPTTVNIVLHFLVLESQQQRYAEESVMKAPERYKSYTKTPEGPQRLVKCMESRDFIC